MLGHSINSSRIAKMLALCVVLAAFVWFGNDLLRLVEGEGASRSYGTPSDGRLEGGVRLPSSGPNFETYSRLGSLVGRTHVERQLRDVIIASYRELEAAQPEQRWVYGETGWSRGGDFWPHRTHQNGLVVDFMVPVLKDGRVAGFPHAPWDGFGYAVDFDKDGRNADDLEIDFDAIAAHLRILDEVARQHDMRVRRVIFAPELRRKMLTTPSGGAIGHLRFNENPVWVRHDDHYHVEFGTK